MWSFQAVCPFSPLSYFFHLLFSLDSVKPPGFALPSLDEISMAHSAVLPLPISPCLSQLLSQQICFLFGPVRPAHLLTRAIPSYTNCIRNTYRKWNIKCNEIFHAEEYVELWLDVVLACSSVLIPVGLSFSVLRNQGGVKERERDKGNNK